MSDFKFSLFKQVLKTIHLHYQSHNLSVLKKDFETRMYLRKSDKITEPSVDKNIETLSYKVNRSTFKPSPFNEQYISNLYFISNIIVNYANED